MSLPLLLALTFGGCGGGDSGLSVDVACDVYSDKAVECLSDAPENDDNIKSAAQTMCVDAIDLLEEANGNDAQCNQAVREWYRCLGVELTCAEVSSGMFDEQTCRSEYFDLAEFCPVQDY